MFTLEPFEAIYFDLGMYHEWRNIGTEAAEVILVHPYVFQLFEQEEEDIIYSRQKNFNGVRLIREYSVP